MEGEEYFEGFENGANGWQVYSFGNAAAWYLLTNGDLWLPDSWYIHSGNWSVGALYGYVGEYQNDWLVSPPIKLQNNPVLTFWHNATYQSWDNFPNHLWISTTGSDPTDFTTIIGDYYEANGTLPHTWEKETINLSQYSGQTIWLAWQYQSEYGEDWFIDDICITNAHQTTTSSGDPIPNSEKIPTLSSKNYLVLEENKDKNSLIMKNAKEPLSTTNSNSKSIFIYNDGSADLIISDIIINYKNSEPTGWITSVKPTSFTILPANSQEVNVAVDNSGLSYGTYHAWLLIYSNDPDENPYNITVNLTVNTNQPPNKPSVVGTTFGHVGTSYLYSINATDPNNDSIYYYIDWGDGNISGWLGPYSSGEVLNILYNWGSPGTYEVKVKAKDEYGNESEWSEPLTVTIINLGNYDLVVIAPNEFSNALQPCLLYTSPSPRD